tara:strand:- start:66 stop:512 length:447 start_codon:yes stop_codon:yes gene_type:complete
VYLVNVLGRWVVSGNDGEHVRDDTHVSQCRVVYAGKVLKKGKTTDEMQEMLTMGTPEQDRNEILLALEPMFKKAKEDGLWFFCQYQQIWQSPAELRANHAKGAFIWGPDSWRLRDPQEGALELYEDMREAEKDYDRFVTRMQGRVTTS